VPDGSPMARSLLAIVAAMVLLASSCSKGDEDAVAIGPGSAQDPPVEQLSGQDPGSEPSWVADVPPVVDPQAEEDARAATLNVAAGFGIAAPPLSPAAVEATSETSYHGTMTIEIAYYDYCQTYDGNLGFAGSATYELPADVIVNPPAENEGVTERSPFNLILAGGNGVEGSLTLLSAVVLTDVSNGTSALFDYWDIDRGQDDQVSGALTDRWAGVDYNFIETTQLLVPCQPNLGSLAMRDAIVEGAQLTGTVSDDRADLEVLAQTLDHEVRFRAVFSTEAD
jgi:hypothetical protein